VKPIENETTSVATMDSGQSEINNYLAVRHNALKHGILSRSVVLPHEDREEFQYLLASLISEHQPNGATEAHLVEELAGIIWRKGRVLLAEGAKINSGLRRSLQATDVISNNTVKNAVPSDPSLARVYVDFRDLMTRTKEQMKIREKEAYSDLEATEKAVQILHRNGKNAYEKALKVLLPVSRQWWQEQLDEFDAEETADSLRDLITYELLPICHSNIAEIRHHEAIKRQFIGEGVEAHVMENLTRYETHLDRKFQRTLAMLIKLKELRDSNK
jgi:hypothetical protein